MLCLLLAALILFVICGIHGVYDCRFAAASTAAPAASAPSTTTAKGTTPQAKPVGPVAAAVNAAAAKPATAPAAAKPTPVGPTAAAVLAKAKAKTKGRPSSFMSYLDIIPRTDVVLEDPTLPPGPPPKSPYPALNPMTTTGKPAQYHVLPAYVRSDFKTGSGDRARRRWGMVPVSLLGDVPGRPGHNPLQLLLDKRDVDRELKAPGTRV
jgi:hypothetical protein